MPEKIDVHIAITKMIFLIQEKKFSPFPITIFCTFYEPKFETNGLKYKKTLEGYSYDISKCPTYALTVCNFEINRLSYSVRERRACTIHKIANLFNKGRYDHVS